MISKADIKLIRSLAKKKYRLKHGLFVAEGEKIVSDLIRDESGKGRYRLRSVYATPDWEMPREAQKDHSFSFKQITGKELKQCSLLTTPNKVMATVEMPVTKTVVQITEPGIILVLDAVRDPGNMGTIIRLAHWFGVSGIICSTDSVDLYNPKTIQATMGSFSAVEVFYADLQEFLTQIRKQRECTIYGSYLEGDNIYSIRPDTNAIIVLGNESSGIDNRLDALIDRKIHIPSFAAGSKPDSLNVASAAAILLSEFRRNSDSSDG